MAGRDLRLNSINRYAKQSPEFVLEEHGHCEVPAGCGGVVLRWRNPHRSIPVRMWSYTRGKAQLFLDGLPPTSSRPLIPYGWHVLSWTISDFDPDLALLFFAGDYQEWGGKVTIWPQTGRVVTMLSGPDDTWRYSLDEPPDNRWMTIDYDDSAWAPLIARPAPVLEKYAPGSYLLKRVQELGAEGLGIADVVKRDERPLTAWIRKRFLLVEREGDQEVQEVRDGE